MKKKKNEEPCVVISKEEKNLVKRTLTNIRLAFGNLLYYGYIYCLCVKKQKRVRRPKYTKSSLMYDNNTYDIYAGNEIVCNIHDLIILRQKIKDSPLKEYFSREEEISEKAMAEIEKKLKKKKVKSE